MNRATNKITRGLVAAFLALSIMPTASMAYVDLRSPDARDAARAAEARDYQDLRSPDARDAGRPAPTPSPPPATSSDSSGFAWDVTAIAAGGVLVALALGATVLITRRRGEPRRSQGRVASS